MEILEALTAEDQIKLSNGLQVFVAAFKDCHIGSEKTSSVICQVGTGRNTVNLVAMLDHLLRKLPRTTANIQNTFCSLWDRLQQQVGVVFLSLQYIGGLNTQFRSSLSLVQVLRLVEVTSDCETNVQTNFFEFNLRRLGFHDGLVKREALQ